MALFHRKLLPKPDTPDDQDSCKPPLPPPTLDHPALPLPLPPSHESVSHSFSPVLIIMFGGLAVSICFICYLLTCASRYRRRQTNRVSTDHEAHEDFIHEDLGPAILNPIWLINTIGLDQSQIESIHVFKYKRHEKLIEGTDCSVCLSEFEDDESLRLLPKCSHAFHVPCIDTWLRSHKNCPLCRAPIFKDTNDQTEPNLIETSTSTSEVTETQDSDSETINDHDHHVVEVENNEEIVKTDLDDQQYHVQGEELVTIRRSFSNGQLVVSKKSSGVTKGGHKLRGSSSSINICGKVTKSSSIRNSLRKASSFTSKCNPLNHSY